MAASSTLLTMALLLHGGVAFAAPSIVARLMPHLPQIDAALGNLVPLGAGWQFNQVLKSVPSSEGFSEHFSKHFLGGT